MTKWKYRFKDYIWNRGEIYFKQGAVVNFQQIENEYCADVIGTDTYHVTIEFQQGRIINMKCTCPNATRGYACKHMAALICKINKQEETIKQFISYPHSKQLQVKEYIHDLSKEELENIVYQYTEQNDSIRNKILIMGSEELSFDQSIYLKRSVDQVIGQFCKQYEREYDYSDLSYMLEDVLNDYIPIMIQKGFHLQAFDLMEYTIAQLQVFEEQYCLLDDYEIQVCYRQCDTIIQTCTKQDYKRIYDWIKHAYPQSNGIQSYIYKRLLTRVFADSIILNQRIDELDQLIKNQSKARDSYIEERIFLMKKRRDTFEDINTYMQKYKEISSIREMQIEYMISMGKVEQAIFLLKESKKIARNAQLLKKWSDRLISIYYMEHRTNEYKEELYFQVEHYPQQNLILINKLKDVCTLKEWKSIKEHIIMNLTGKTLIDFYKQEEMYDDMLHEVLHESVSLIDDYTDLLAAKYPNEIMDYYLKHMDACMQLANNRKEYRKIIQYFHKIEYIPEANVRLHMFTKKWREQYNTRRALLDELSKAGY